MKINKNKVAPPFREAEFDILYGQGISRTGEVIDVAVELGIVKKAAHGSAMRIRSWDRAEKMPRRLWKRTPI